MEISAGLKKKLKNAGITEDELSNNEKKYLTQINDFYESYVQKKTSLKDELKKTKFTKSSVSSNVDCSRQTLYKNPTLMKFVDYCLNDSKQYEASDSGYVSKEKYQALKEENKMLLFNIVDQEEKEVTIERLTRELNEKEQRIQNLTEYITKNMNNFDPRKRTDLN